MSAPAPSLTVLSGPDAAALFTLKPGRGVLGRHADAAYKLTDPRASRMHCEVEWANGIVTVTDNGSAAGTLVNGVAVTDSMQLRSGDTVQVGDTVLRLGTGGGETATLPPGRAADREPAVGELSELSGRTLVRYAIGAPLGRGTTSMVFRATNTDDGTPVALKVMHPDYGQNPDEVQRFVRAMKSTAGFDHPNIVRTLAAGKDGPYCWVALELVEGESLTDVIKRIGVANMLDWKYAHRVGLHIGRALGYAHSRGVVHRDIAPANILFETATRRAKLGDLMLAKAIEGAQARQITRPGQMVGDVNYMSPERAGGGGGVDARSDLFSLGATCYTLLCGKPPFAGTNLIDTLSRVRTAEPEKPTKFQMGIPSTFEHAVLKLLAKRPDDRYQTAAEWVAELERVGKFNGAPTD
jgi:serine/threonine protein kinase